MAALFLRSAGRSGGGARSGSAARDGRPQGPLNEFRAGSGSHLPAGGKRGCEKTGVGGFRLRGSLRWEDRVGIVFDGRDGENGEGGKPGFYLGHRGGAAGAR